MASRKHLSAAANIGTGDADTLAAMIAAGRSNYEIAAAMGCHKDDIARELAAPAPFPLKPLNWTASSAVGSVAPYVGVATQVYAGPSTPGYTYGAPVAARSDFT
jgi:hypothetical protein